MPKKILKKFFELESATAILLFAATALALVIANSSISQLYFQTLKISLPLSLDFLQITKNLSLKDWINDALMALFFFLIGLELKKEILIGELSTKKKIALPAIAAIGGVIFPALIFFAFNYNQPQNLRGFAIPTATDIAFAYGIICFFGKKIPYSLKVFIVTLAVLDDLIAILIIAIFYTQNLKILYFVMAFLPLIGLAFLNFRKSDKFLAYLILGILLWLMILQSGIHATLAGVLLSLFIPLKINGKNFLENLAHKISPIVNFVILPIFALANCGVKIAGLSFDIFSQSLTLGIIFGLFFGKQIGVMLFSFLAVRLKIAALPSDKGRPILWRQFYSVAIFTGIGFTMSLFIGELSFVQNNTLEDLFEIILDQLKIGILITSILSILFGSLIMYVSIKTAKPKL